MSAECVNVYAYACISVCVHVYARLCVCVCIHVVEGNRPFNIFGLLLFILRFMQTYVHYMYVQVLRQMYEQASHVCTYMYVHIYVPYS